MRRLVHPYHPRLHRGTLLLFTRTSYTRQASSRVAAFYDNVHKLNANYVSHENKESTPQYNEREQNVNGVLSSRKNNANDETSGVAASSTHLIETWQVRPTRLTSALESSDLHNSAANMNNNFSEEESVIHMPPLIRTQHDSQAINKSTRGTTPSHSSLQSPYAADMRLGRELRAQMRRRISAFEMDEMCRAVRQAYNIACEVYSVLYTEIDEPLEAFRRKRTTTTTSSSSKDRQIATTYRPCHPSLEMIVHERVGQLQRTLRGLHSAHYDVVLREYAAGRGKGLTLRDTHLSSRMMRHMHSLHKTSHNSTPNEAKDGKQASVHPLLAFTELLVCILRSLRRLPRRTAGRITLAQAETYSRTCGAAHAIRNMLTVLVHHDQLAEQTPNKRRTSNANEEERAVQRQKYIRLSEEDVLLLFDAVLALPSQDSPAFTLPVYTDITGALAAQLYLPHKYAQCASQQYSSSTQSISAKGMTMLTMSAEEWCVRRLLSFPGLKLRMHNKAKNYNRDKMEDNKVKTHFASKDTNSGRTQRMEVRRHELALRQAVSVVRRCMYSLITNSEEIGKGTRRTHSNSNKSGLSRAATTTTPQVSTLRVPYGVGRAMTEWLLTELALWLPSTTTTTATSDSNDVLETIHVHDLATLCSAVLFYKIYNCTSALHVMLATAPRCVRQVDELSGADIANMLLAYASLKYTGDISHATNSSGSTAQEQSNEQENFDHGSTTSTSSATNKSHSNVLQNFYFVLGTRAGQLADTLSEEDVVKVLRAFEMTAIEHGTLRASLESSLRMRYVYEAPTYG